MQLMKREKAIVACGAGLLAMLVVVQFVVRPARERISTLRRVVADKRDVLAQIQAKGQDYRNLETQVAQLRSMVVPQQESRRILSTLERIREECGLPQQTLSLKPTTAAIDDKYQQTVVEVRLEGVTLAQIVAFLNRLDALVLAGGIRSLEVRRADRDPGLLRATVQLTTVAHAAAM